MVRSFAWVLNFDADEELARPAGYTPSRAVAARAPALVARVAALLGPDDIVLEPPADSPDPHHAPGAPMGAELEHANPATTGAPREGRAFCPTPRALRRMRRAGVAVPAAPPLDVLQQVNHRRFCAELGQPLPGARYVERLDELEAVIAGDSPTGQWLLKRPFGFAGRGRWRVARGPLDPAARPWVIASLAPRPGGLGGLQVEPWVERRGDFSLHGHVAQSGAVQLGAPCVQRCDERGTYEGAARAGPGDLGTFERNALEGAALEAGLALASAGYFGPFGIDAFRWEDARGEIHWNPRCEINARYTMAWAIGMGEARPDRE